MVYTSLVSVLFHDSNRELGATELNILSFWFHHVFVVISSNSSIKNPIFLNEYEDFFEMWRKTWQIIISCSTPKKRFTRCRPLTVWPARGKSCKRCCLLNRFAKGCRNQKAATPRQQGIYIKLWSTSEGRHSAITVSFLAKYTGADLDDTPDFLYKRRFGGVALRQSVQLVTAVGSPIISIGAFSAIDWTTRDIVSQSVNIVFQLRQPVLTRGRQQTSGVPSSYP